jgi:hypothetical protein
MPDPAKQSISATQGNLPAREYLLAAFEYQPETGELRWRWRDDVPKRTNTLCAGRVAGTLSGNGYLVVKMWRRMHLVHRIIFKMLNGYEPIQVDHRDGDRINNRPGNLRAADSALNNRNRSRRRGKALPKGVHLGRPGKFRARLMVNGRRVDFGTFDRAEEAASAVRAGVAAHHGEYGRTE